MAEEKTTRKKAVALRYDPAQSESPKVVAGGQGHIAEQILELARQHNIPIHEDRDLVEILSHLEPGMDIPPETYLMVAEILAFIYQANDKAANQDNLP